MIVESFVHQYSKFTDSVTRLAVGNIDLLVDVIIVIIVIVVIIDVVNVADII